MGLPSYVINFDELVNDLSKYLADGIHVNVGDVVIDTTKIQDLLDAINKKIPDISLTDLLNALGDLNITVKDLSIKLGLKGTQKYYGKVLEIPVIKGEYEISFVADENWLVTDITYSLSSWNYQDNWSLYVDSDMIFSTVYTKEFGENKHFEVYQEVKKDSKVRFVFNNNSEANKILWVDLGVLGNLGDIPSSNTGGNGGTTSGGSGSTITTTTASYLRRFVATDVSDPNYVSPSSLNMNYWTMANENIPNEFWSGRNTLLQLLQDSCKDGSVYTNSKISNITNYHKYLYRLQQDIRVNKLVLSDWRDDYNQFLILCNKDIASGGYGLQSLSDVEKTQIYLTYIFQTVTLIFPSCQSLLTADYINQFKKYLPVEKLRVLEWIDFNEVTPDNHVGAYDLDLMESGDLKTFRTYMNVEPSALDPSVFSITDDMILNPYFFKKHVSGQPITGDNVISTGFFPGYEWEFKNVDSIYHVGDAKTIATRVFLHELGHGVDYQFSTDGIPLTDKAEWRDIGGWQHGDASSIPKLIVTKWACDCTETDKEPPISFYGATLTKEDFAEAFACYYINPKYLQKYFPKRYAFIEKYVKNFTTS